ncbi:phospholipid-transporting ATPase-like protein [Trypanosoma conorhini]|uniref:Phospholipid-transporting ATPase-like protein n=1 Tax=Trypanosoma conorhini TaxID=83891 RepID=A0A3S5ITH1_9TRYP|nr:phospholipid-transporting ATPase-like protein [Trypanosoma conorhini]RNF17848.1 phospholipid-transporting ATPase-like protein [Trypanosoma conorhini]
MTLSVYSAIKLFFFPDILQLQRLIIHMMSRVPLLSRSWPFWVEENPSRFWRSFSALHLCRGPSRVRRGSPVVDTLSIADLQAAVTAEREFSEPVVVKAAVEAIRDSTALSEPLLKRA